MKMMWTVGFFAILLLQEFVVESRWLVSHGLCVCHARTGNSSLTISQASA